MADKTAEQLSALIDGEGEIREWELALRRLGNDAELKDRWQRYHLIGEALKNNLPDTLDLGFAERIRQTLETEQPLALPAPAIRGGVKGAVASWYKPMTGFALAASVAGLALVGLNLSDAGVAESAGPIAKAGPSPELNSRLGTYLVNHHRVAGSSVPGVTPYYQRLVINDSKP